MIEAKVRTRDDNSKAYKDYKKKLNDYYETLEYNETMGFKDKIEEPKKPKNIYTWSTGFLSTKMISEDVSHIMIDVEDKNTISLCFRDNSVIIIEKNEFTLTKLKELI